jgi:hypothetical protein
MKYSAAQEMKKKRERERDRQTDRQTEREREREREKFAMLSCIHSPPFPPFLSSDA